jgi:hypothetical protein
LNKLLGEHIPNSPVSTDGVHPRATWQANPNIAKWGLTWREMDDGYVEIGCSIVMKDVMLLGHGNVLEVLAMGDNIDVWICLLPLGGAEGDAQPDYIVVRLPWDKCSEVVCGDKTNGVGMVFDEGKFPESEDKLMGCWAHMTSTRLARNAKIGMKKSKAIKKKASAPSSVGGGKAENSAPRKSKAKAKESDDVILDIDEALRRGDKLSMKTRPQDIDKTYRALEIGLADCFLYKKNRILGSFHSERLHIASDSMKYRRILKSCLEQVTSCPCTICLVLASIGWQPILFNFNHPSCAVIFLSADGRYTSCIFGSRIIHTGPRY